MKKSLYLLLVTLMLFGFSSFASAAPDDGSLFSLDAVQTVPLDVSGPDTGDRGQWRLEVAQEFHDEFDQLNALNITTLQIRIEMLEKHAQIGDLLLTAMENQDRTKLEAVRQVRQELTAQRSQLQQTRQGIQEARQAFVAAVKDHDLTSAQASIDQWISLKSTFNGLLEESDGLLQEMIEALS